MAELYSIVYMYHNSFIHSSVGGHLDCFRVLAIVNCTAVNIGIHVCFSIMVFSGPIIEKHGVEYPTVCVKKMRTLWGSCSRNNQKINLNFYLYKASVPCVEYVILHELTHFLYPHHDRDFYDFITIHMPDWQYRKQQLDYEFVLGI